MEDAGKKPDEACEPSVLSDNQEAKNGVSTQDDDTGEEQPNVEVMEEVVEKPWESQPQDGEVEERENATPQTIISLQRDLSTIVTNIQTAAGARELLRRTKLEEARRIRLQQLDNDANSSQAKFEEITRKWSVAKEKVIPQELQEALNSQQQLCSAVIEDKKKCVNDLQQELKVSDDHFVKDLRKQAEEVDLMIERMDEQIKTLTKAYREELAQMERVYKLESEILLTKDETEWEQHIRELWDKELERLDQRKEKVDEYEKIIHNLMLESITNHSISMLEKNKKFQVLEREQQLVKDSSMIVMLKQIRETNQITMQKINLTLMRNRIGSLHTEMKNLGSKYTKKKKEFTKISQYFSKSYKRDIQHHEHMQRKIKHCAAADARKFKKMWLMLDAEVKQLADRALVIDSQICKHLGSSWGRPPMVFMEGRGPHQPQKPACRPTHQADSELFQTGQDLQCSQRSMTYAESRDIKMYKEGTAVQSESGAEVKEGRLSVETLKKVMELLCDEAGFLIEEKLTPLDKEDQAITKLSFLISTFGIEEKDLPKLADFLLKYQQQQTELGASSDLAEAAGTSSTTNLTSDVIHPNHVLPALKGFLEQHMMSRESSAQQHSSLLHFEARDSSENKAYWESMGNIISEDKVRLWEAAENTLKQYLAVLTDISDLIPETESLEQQNKELRMLLQQSLNSTVSTETENS